MGRRRKNQDLSSKRKHNNSDDNYESESDTDLQYLLSQHENHKSDIERGKDSNHYIPKRNLQNSYKDDDTFIEKTYQWWLNRNEAKKEKLSDPEESPELGERKSSRKNPFNSLNLNNNPLSTLRNNFKIPAFHLPQINLQNWISSPRTKSANSPPTVENQNKNKFAHSDNNSVDVQHDKQNFQKLDLPPDSKYRQDIPDDEIQQDLDLSYYRPSKSKRAIRTSHLEKGLDNESNCTTIKVDTFQKTKEEREITKLEDFHQFEEGPWSPSSTTQAWASPLSNASNGSIDLPFLSPMNEDIQKKLSNVKKLTPLKIPPPKLKLKSQKSNTTTYNSSPSRYGNNSFKQPNNKFPSNSFSNKNIIIKSEANKNKADENHLLSPPLTRGKAQHTPTKNLLSSPPIGSSPESLDFEAMTKMLEDDGLLYATEDHEVEIFQPNHNNTSPHHLLNEEFSPTFSSTNFRESEHSSSNFGCADDEGLEEDFNHKNEFRYFTNEPDNFSDL